MARKCAQSKEQLQKARREWERTGVNRATRRKARKIGVSPVAEVKSEEKKEESQKQA
jgi:hypothetical protein